MRIPGSWRRLGFLALGALSTTSLVLVACGDSDGRGSPLDEGDGGPGGGGDADVTTACTFAPRDGWVRGLVHETAAEFEFPEVTCTPLRDREGTIWGFRFAFGTYVAPDAPDHVAMRVVLENVDPFDGGEIIDSPAAVTLRWPNDLDPRHDSGALDFDPASRRGTFKSTLVDLEIACDPDDDFAGGLGEPVPALAPPGTAIITRGPRHHVTVLRGVTCERTDERSLRVVRVDHVAGCDFDQLALEPTSELPILGVGTYPDFFSVASVIVTDLDGALVEGRGTLDVSQVEPAYAGFASFAASWGGVDRVEFACPVP